jgi:hypothetical protein
MDKVYNNIMNDNVSSLTRFQLASVLIHEHAKKMLPRVLWVIITESNDPKWGCSFCHRIYESPYKLIKGIHNKKSADYLICSVCVSDNTLNKILICDNL